MTRTPCRALPPDGRFLGLSRLFDPSRKPGLVELDIADELGITTSQALLRPGFPVGPSSGLNYAAAILAAQRLGPNAKVVTVFPDRMERYLSTELIRRPLPPPRPEPPDLAAPWPLPSR